MAQNSLLLKCIWRSPRAAASRELCIQNQNANSLLGIIISSGSLRLLCFHCRALSASSQSTNHRAREIIIRRVGTGQMTTVRPPQLTASTCIKKSTQFALRASKNCRKVPQSLWHYQIVWSLDFFFDDILQEFSNLFVFPICVIRTVSSSLALGLLKARAESGINLCGMRVLGQFAPSKAPRANHSRSVHTLSEQSLLLGC